MSATICGHERDVLIWALKLWATIASGGVAMYVAGTGRGKVAKSNAFGDVNDPAKLAELMASALWERGIVAETWTSRYDLIGVRIGDFTPLLLDMPQTHAALLRILELPESVTAQDAMKALRPEYADPDELLNTIPANESLERRQNESNPGRQR